MSARNFILALLFLTFVLAVACDPIEVLAEALVEALQTRSRSTPSRPTRSTQTRSTQTRPRTTPSRPRTTRPRPRTTRPTRPRTTRPRTTRPRTTRPRTTKPRTTRPRTTRTRTTRPRTTKPRTTKPRTTKPRTTKPRTQKPRTQKPGTQKPRTTKPSTQKPRTTKPATTKPATTKPATSRPSNLPAGSSFAAKQADKIIGYEGRFDKNGNLKVYQLPSGDGGGKYEVAGINDRYHPQAAAHLKSLVEQGKHAEARAYAADYLGKYTDKSASASKIPAIQFYLRDSSFNRGPGGASKILQHALGVPTNGKMNQQTMDALRRAEQNPQQLLKNLRASREWYERTYAHRDESSKFWKGLTNRWNNAYRDAEGFGFTPIQ